MKLALEDRIRERAYFLSLSVGGAGDATNFWLVAEQEELAEAAKESTVGSAEAIRSAQAGKPTDVVQAIKTACLGAILHVSKHRQLFVLPPCKPAQRRLEAASRYSPQSTSLHPM